MTPDYESLWEKYAEYIGTEIDDVQQIAGTSVLTKLAFDDLTSELPQPLKPELYEMQADTKAIQKLRNQYVKYWNEYHVVVLSYPMWLEEKLTKKPRKVKK